MRYQHGGDVYSYAEQFSGVKPLDFSANINPRGIPLPVQHAMHAAIDQCMQYPDPECRELRRALGQRWKLSPEYFFCANGAAEIFYRLASCIKPKKALITAPTFGEYEAALTTVGCSVRFYPLQICNNFCVTSDILNAITPDISVVILCNPNNPTGRTIASNILEQIVEHCQKFGIWLILDECFGDFLIDAPVHTMRPWLDRYDRLVIVRAFTKMYAVPGIRLGWCMSHNLDFITQLHFAGQPWNVSIIAQACGVAALSCTDWEQDTARQIAESRESLASALSALGMQVFPSEVNYLLFISPMQNLREELMQRGILIRSCANYRGLGTQYFRIAVKSPEDNQVFIQNVKEVLVNGCESNYGTGDCI